jgi:hypothetical protein
MISQQVRIFERRKIRLHLATHNSRLERAGFAGRSTARYAA